MAVPVEFAKSPGAFFECAPVIYTHASFKDYGVAGLDVVLAGISPDPWKSVHLQSVCDLWKPVPIHSTLDKTSLHLLHLVRSY